MAVEGGEKRWRAVIRRVLTAFHRPPPPSTALLAGGEVRSFQGLLAEGGGV